MSEYKPKFQVCPNCEGEGYIGTLGAYTSSEFEESFGDDVDSYMELHEASKVACECCKGKRVVTDSELDEWNSELEYRAEREAERRFGC